LTLWQAGILQETMKSRSVPSFNLQVDSRSGSDWKFSADNWSHSTSYFVGQLKKIEKPRWNKIVEAAKVYFELHGQLFRKAGPSSAQNMKIEDSAEIKNLEFKWDSD
jgi:hypothetical protein